MLRVVGGGGGGQDWACSVAGTGLGSEEAAFEVARPREPEEEEAAGCGGPGWGCAGLPDPAPGGSMLQAGAAEPARGGRGAEEPLGERVAEGEERPARHPPAPPALRLPSRKPQGGGGGSGETKTPEHDLQRGRLRRGPRAAPPASAMDDRGGQQEPPAPHAPGAPAGASGHAAAVNGLLHNGFHPPPPPAQPPRLCSRGPAGGGDAAPPRLPLQPELQPQPPPPQHDSPAKKCRLRRRMDSGKKNRPRKSAGRAAGSAGGRQRAARGAGHRGTPGRAPRALQRPPSGMGGLGHRSEGRPELIFTPERALRTRARCLSLSLARFHL